jgi:tRNA threonylcarbamoyladenosine biosynthesis protein TsaE
MARTSTPTGAATVDARVVSRSTDETIELGRRLASVARAGDLVCLWGDLGAGKTQLAKGFGRGLGVADTINSPTFILMAEYPDGRLPLFHVDLYRLSDASEALAGGVIDDRQSDGVTLVEWPDRLGPALPGHRLDVVIEGEGDAERTISIRPLDPDLARYATAVR